MTALALIGGFFLFLLAGVARSILADEAKGWVRDLGLLLVRRAVTQLPHSRQEEKQLEWEGEFAEQASKPISALLWSWRLFRSRRFTAHELRVAEDSIPPLASPDALALKAAPDEMPPYLRSAIDSLHAYGWQRVISAMQDATLGQVEDRIETATVRFFAVIDEARAVSDAPLPRFGPPPGTHAWTNTYDPAPPQLRPGFQIYNTSRQEVVPPRERWAMRLIRGFLALDARLQWIAGLTLMLLAIGAPVWFCGAIIGAVISLAFATPLRRVAMLLSSGALYFYVLYLWPIVIEHEIVGFDVSRAIAWALLAAWVAAFLMPDRMAAVLTQRITRLVLALRRKSSRSR